MSKENIKKLVDALRSGNYEQGRGCLNSNGKFCCLGVATDIYQKEVGDLIENVMFANGIPMLSYDDNESTLPDKVVRWFGFGSRNPDSGEMKLVSGFNPDGRLYNASFAELNDIYKYSFSEIADIFERIYLKED